LLLDASIVGELRVTNLIVVIFCNSSWPYHVTTTLDLSVIRLHTNITMPILRPTIIDHDRINIYNSQIVICIVKLHYIIALIIANFRVILG
jgi:hypothetical protein